MKDKTNSTPRIAASGAIRVDEVFFRHHVYLPSGTQVHALTSAFPGVVAMWLYPESKMVVVDMEERSLIYQWDEVTVCSKTS